MSNPASLARIRKHYRGRRAAEEISFEARTGEILGLAGLNGAGKTTAIKILLGLVKQDAGEASLLPGQARRFGDVGYLPELSAHPAALTAREVLGTVRALAGNGGMSEEEVLEKAGLLHAADVRTGAFSKGMARRLGLAAVLITRPAVIVLDEPQSGLDPLGRETLKRILEEHRAAGGTAIFASHDLNEVAELSDRVVLIHEGRDAATLGRDEIAGGGLKRRFFALWQGPEPSEPVS